MLGVGPELRVRKPIRCIFSGCARAAIGQAAAALPRSAMNSRRLMASPAPTTTSGVKTISHLDQKLCSSLHPKGAAHVRFGSLADIEARPRDVRFTSKSGHTSASSRCPLCANNYRMHRSKYCHLARTPNGPHLPNHIDMECGTIRDAGVPRRGLDSRLRRTRPAILRTIEGGPS